MNEDSNGYYVNPEPPTEILQMKQDDLIGNTLFSKHWLCEVLLKLIKKCENIEVNESDEEAEGFKELEADFEKDLCDLWDMSVEKDVCIELENLNAVQIFEAYIKKYDQVYPRAIELLIGILVNMVSLSNEIGLKVVNNKSLMHYLIFNIFGSMIDVQTIIQAIRLFSLFLNSNESGISENKIIKNSFIEYMKTDLESNEYEMSEDLNNDSLPNWRGIIEKFYFILEQSLNPILLDATISFLFNLFDNDDQFLDSLAINQRLVDAICNATQTRLRLDRMEKSFTSSQFTTTNRENYARLTENRNSSNYLQNEKTPSVSRLADNVNHHELLMTQLSQEDITSIDHIYNKYLLCLQIISTNENGVVSLHLAHENVIALLSEYLEMCLQAFNEWEIRSSNSLRTNVGEESLQNLVCILSIVNCIFSNQKSAESSVFNDQSYEFLIKLFTFTRHYLSFLNSFKNQDVSPSSSPTTSNKENFELIKSNLKELFSCIQNLKLEKNSQLNFLFEKCVSLLENN